MVIDPLDRIWLKTEQVEGEQRKILADMIFPFAGADPENGKVYFNANGESLGARYRILVYLLGRLALSIRPNSTFSARVSPKEMETVLGLSGGTVRPSLQKLLSEKVVTKDGEGYMVTAQNLTKAYKLLEPMIEETREGTELGLDTEAEE